MTERRARRPPKKAGYHHGDLRRALIESALDVIAREDPSAVSLRELASRVGVTHAAPYRHFRDKESLLATVAAEGFKLLRAAMVRARDAAGADPVARLRATGVGYVRFAVASPGYFKVMFSHVGVPPDDDASGVAGEGAAAFGVLLDAIAVAQGAGVVRGGDARSHAVFAWSATHGLASLLVEKCLREHDAPVDPEALTAQLLDDLMAGLTPR